MDPINPSEPNTNALDFSALLRLLSAEGSADESSDGLSPAQIASESFETLRRRLIRYFIWERCQDPELCADETLSRTARKLAEGEKIINLRAYLFGVARVISRETSARASREASVLEQLASQHPAIGQPDDGSDGDLSAPCLNECLALLSEEQREFILRYYRGNQGERIENRRKLAEEEGLGLNALRNRASRLRDRLEKCTRRCMRRIEKP